MGIIINLSQRGGSHCRPLMAFLNREFKPDFIAKSGNKCLKLETILTWINNQITSKDDIHKTFEGTNRHNSVWLKNLLPLDEKIDKNGKYQLVKTDTISELEKIIFDSQKEELRATMDCLADYIIKKLGV